MLLYSSTAFPAAGAKATRPLSVCMQLSRAAMIGNKHNLTKQPYIKCTSQANGKSTRWSVGALRSSSVPLLPFQTSPSHSCSTHVVEVRKQLRTRATSRRARLQRRMYSLRIGPLFTFCRAERCHDFGSLLSCHRRRASRVRMMPVQVYVWELLPTASQVQVMANGFNYEQARFMMLGYFPCEEGNGDETNDRLGKVAQTAKLLNNPLWLDFEAPEDAGWTVTSLFPSPPPPPRWVGLVNLQCLERLRRRAMQDGPCFVSPGSRERWAGLSNY